MRRVATLVLAALVVGAGAAEPSGADAWRRLDAAARRAAKDADGARADLEQLLLEHPTLYAASYDLGCLLLDAEPEAATKRFAAAATSPQAELAANAWHNLALAHQRLGRLAEALAAEMHAVELRPDDGELIRTRDELRRVLLARQDEARLKALAEAKKLAIATRALPDAHVGEAYDQRVAARGGCAPYRFALGEKAALPAGLALDPDGRVHGTPSAAGDAKAAVTVQDMSAPTPGTASGDIALRVVPAPAIATTALPEAIVGVDYRAEITATGLDAPRWSIDGLPGGLALSQDGGRAAIVGTPTTTGDAALRVRAADGERAAEATLPLTVSDLFAPSETRLPPATAWARYQHRVGVRGPPQDYRWAQAKADDGVAVAADGTFAGPPGRAGEIALHATITAADGRARDVALTLPVNPPPVIEVDDTIAAQQGRILDQPLKVTGGTPPLRWAVSDGALAKGVRLEPDGHLRGAPAETGDFAFTLQVVDRWQATTEAKTTLHVEKPDDQAKQDQQGGGQQPPDQKNDQAKQDQQKDQAKQDAKNGEPKNDQAKQDGKTDKGKNDQAKQDAKNGEPKNDEKKNDEPNNDQAKQGGKSGEPAKDEPTKQDQRSDPRAQQRDAKGGRSGDDDRAGRDGSGDAHGDQAKAGARANPSAADQPADQRQAESMTSAAAARWLEQLPPEDRSGLRTQLLLDANVKPRRGAQTW